MGHGKRFGIGNYSIGGYSHDEWTAAEMSLPHFEEIRWVFGWILQLRQCTTFEESCSQGADQMLGWEVIKPCSVKDHPGVYAVYEALEFNEELNAINKLIGVSESFRKMLKSITHFILAKYFGKTCSARVKGWLIDHMNRQSKSAFTDYLQECLKTNTEVFQYKIEPELQQSVYPAHERALLNMIGMCPCLEESRNLNRSPGDRMDNYIKNLRGEKMITVACHVMRQMAVPTSFVYKHSTLSKTIVTETKEYADEEQDTEASDEEQDVEEIDIDMATAPNPM